MTRRSVSDGASIPGYGAADRKTSIYLGRRMLAVARVSTRYQQALLRLIYQSQEDEIVLRHKRKLLQMSSIYTKGDGNSGEQQACSVETKYKSRVYCGEPNGGR